MIEPQFLVVTVLLYGGILFAVAAFADWQAARGRLRLLHSPLIYTLSLSVYCTAWTFYGAAGNAVRGGLDFLPIYLGPTLMFLAWYGLPRKLVRIVRAERITSIADLISSRFGKSPLIGALVTLLALIAATPYIALQLQSMVASIAVLTGQDAGGAVFWLAAGLAAFAVLFGTRTVDVHARHPGVVMAIAVEAVIKLLALLAVGLYVTFGLWDGPADILAATPPQMLAPSEGWGSRWLMLNGLSAMAVITLPRMFQVLAVETADERSLATAAWAFPAYLLLISMFVIPIATAGLALLPEGTNPDMFVLTVPLASGAETLALIAFLGGFSAATSMVIVSSIALSVMVSNHIIMPIWLSTGERRPRAAGDVRQVLVLGRRVTILLVLGLGYLYERMSGGGASLASIGLIAFAGMAQLVPALLAGITWRGATRQGAAMGLVIGAALWLWTLFLPGFEGRVLMSAGVIADGPWGIGWLRPEALFGAEGLDPLVHGLSWSLGFNTLAVISVSLVTRPRPLERLQAVAFIDPARGGTADMQINRVAAAEDLFTLAQRILGADPAYRLFAHEARLQNRPRGLPEATPAFIAALERELAGSVGSASAHAMVSRVAGGSVLSVDELVSIADETAEIRQYSRKLEAQSRTLAETARKLRNANIRLTEIGAQKDAFLSQVSHELRTPMTSIRAFADLLRENRNLSPEDQARFVGIIFEESARLTRLLDEILDLAFLESGHAGVRRERVMLDTVISRALETARPHAGSAGLALVRDPKAEAIAVRGDPDRLAQVFINLLTNALKYGDQDAPRIEIRAGQDGAMAWVEIEDNGPGIAPEAEQTVFEKFTRLSPQARAGSAGLGLAISREIMRGHGGDLRLMAGPDGPGAPHGTCGAIFRVELPGAG